MTPVRAHLRRVFSGAWWRRWVTVLVGVAVVAGMVVVAESARRDAERHLRAQMLMERIRAGSQEIGSVNWQARANALAGETTQQMVKGGLVREGYRAWDSIQDSLRALRAIEPGREAAKLTHSLCGRSLRHRHAGAQRVSRLRIEEAEQAAQLRLMRSSLGQGFPFSKPITGDQLWDLLCEGRPLKPGSGELRSAGAGDSELAPAG